MESEAALRAEEAMRGMASENDPKLVVRDEALHPLVAKLVWLLKWTPLPAADPPSAHST